MRISRTVLITALVAVLSSSVLQVDIAIAQHGWTWQNPRPQGNALNDVIHLAGSDWLAFGDHGTIIRSSDDGITWTHQYFGSTDGIVRACFTSPEHGYVLSAGSVFKTSNIGRSWNEQIRTQYTLTDIDFADADNGIAVGSFGTILHTWDAGITWEYRDSETQSEFHAVAFDDASNAVIAGANGVLLRSSNGGVSWSMGAIEPGSRIQDLEYIPGSIGKLIAVGDNGTVLLSTDGGESWNSASHTSTSDLKNVHFTDENNGIIAGSGGTLLRSTNGGENWIDLLAVGGADLRGLDAHGLNALVVAGNGTVLRSNDGGINWSGAGPVTTSDLKCVAFSDASTGIVAGVSGALVWTTNGGQDWINQHSSTSDDILDICTVGGIVYAVSKGGSILRTTIGDVNWQVQYRDTSVQLRGVSFIDANNGIVVGTDGTILHTDDGGDTWTTRTNETYPNLNDVLLIDTQTAMAVGLRGTLISTTDGGITWSYPLVGMQEELTCISALTDGVIFVAGSRGTILRSSTLGLSWELQNVGNHFLATLNSISFGDANTGVAVGDGGALLVTTDGGTTWASQPEVTRYGLNAVTMHDARTGTIVGNNGVILRTITGGVSWVANEQQLPAQLHLGQNYPNPVIGGTSIPFTLLSAGHASLSVHDMLGRRVALLADTFLDAGGHSIYFDASALPPGVYACVLRTANGAVSKILPVIGTTASR